MSCRQFTCLAILIVAAAFLHSSADGQLPAITLNPVSVGVNLQVRGIGRLSVPAPRGGVAVTLTSQDPAITLLATAPTSAGSSSIIVNVPEGATTLPNFYVYGIEVGLTRLLVAAPGYAFAAGNTNVAPGAVSVSPSGFEIVGPNGAGQPFITTASSPDTHLTIRAMQLDSTRNPLTPGVIRGGITVGVKISSSNAAVGRLGNVPVLFTGGISSVSSAAFHPISQGATHLSLDISGAVGFSPPISGDKLDVNVVLPEIQFSLPTTNLGVNLQLDAFAKLTAPAPAGGLSVIIQSDRPQILLSSDATITGSPSICLTVPEGAGVDGIGFPSFYIQALPGSAGATASLTASATGYVSGRAKLTITPSAFVISSVNGMGQDFAIGSWQPPNPIVVAAMQLDSGLLPQSQQAVRGGLTLAVEIQNEKPAVGEISESAALFAGGIRSRTLHFRPRSAGTTLLSVSVLVSFSNPSQGGALHATVN